ncbi:MAG: tetratricopeptide repeat protein [Candidatus Aminicenantes bacterium]|nr:tetratricopeptide repeat protein [Candidatus Aminicenantes bacterium]
MKIRTFFVCSFLALWLAGCAAHRGASSRPIKPGPEVFELHLRQGLALLVVKEYRKAAAELQAAESLNPNSVRVHNYLGLCRFQQMDYDPALMEFQKAAELDPSFAAAYNNMGGVYSMKLQFDKAEEMYKKALSLSPDMISANYCLGMLLSNLGRRDEGSVYLSRGIALNPDYLEKHQEFHSTFASVTFDMKEAYFAFAKAYALTGDVDKTVSYLEKARKAGFTDWRRILEDNKFEKVRDDPKIKKFLI